jgi:DNA polymerase III subunit epsilon
VPEADHIAVDFETTGLSPWRGARILEVAAIAIRNNSVVGEFHSLVNPGIRIPAAASEIHGIREEMMKNAPDSETVMHAFRRFIGKTLLIAHNAPFERRFLQAEMARIGKGFLNPFRCTLKMSRKKCPDLENYRLETVARHLLGQDMENVQFHRALDDARVTAKIFQSLCKKGNLKS